MKLSRVYREICLPLQETTGRTVVIAGGAVRDHLLGRKPRDYDVFVLSGKLGPPKVNKLVKDIRNYLLGMGTDSGQSYLSFSVTSKYGASDNTGPVAEFYFWGHKVQVMVSPVAIPQQLVATFDYNICKLYYPNAQHSGEHSVVANIKQHGALKLVGTAPLPYPALTLRRGMEFASRYGMQLPDTTVEYLCKLIVNPMSHAGINSGTTAVATALEASWFDTIMKESYKLTSHSWGVQ